MNSVLVYGLTNNRGGMEAYFATYFEEIKRQSEDLRIDFVTDYPDIAFREVFEKYGAKIFFIPSRRDNLFLHMKKLRKLVIENKYDKVYFNLLSASAVFSVASVAKIKECEIIVHSHNDCVKAIKRHVVLRPILNYFTDTRLACSEAAGIFMFGEKYVQHGKVTVIKNAINTEKYVYSEQIRQKVRKEFHVGSQPILGTVGRLCYQKNTIFLIELFSKVLQVIPEAFLMLIGEGEDHELVERKIAELGIENRVWMLGMRNDIPELLMGMDLFLLPSRFEGLPIAVVEAQCAGLPVLASQNVSEAIELTENVKRLSLENQDIWVREIRKLLENRIERKSRIDELRESGFDIKQQAEVLRNIIKDEV